MIKAVITDLGGVLVRTEDWSPREKLAAGFGLNRAGLEDLVFAGEFGTPAQMGRLTHAELWNAVAGELGLSQDQVPELARQFWAGDRLDTDLVDFFRGLRPEVATGLLSNAFDDLRRQLEEVWQIDDAFDAMVISAEEGRMKPDPAIYRLAADRLGVSPGEAVFLDDLPGNVVGARSAGMQAVHFREPAQALAEIRAILASKGAQPGTGNAG